MTARLTRFGGAPVGPWTAVGTEPIDTDRFGSRRTVIYGTVTRLDDPLFRDRPWRIRIATATPPRERAAHGYRDFTLDQDLYGATYRTRTEARDALVATWKHRHHDRITLRPMTPTPKGHPMTPTAVRTTASLGAYTAGGPYGTKYDATIPLGAIGLDLGPWPEPIGYDPDWRLIRVTINGLDYDVPALPTHYELIGGTQ